MGPARAWRSAIRRSTRISAAPLIAVVPVTGTAGEGTLYPAFPPGKIGLTRASYALIDHLRSVDKRRMRRVFGRITTAELAALDQGLELFLGPTSEP